MTYLKIIMVYTISGHWTRTLVQDLDLDFDLDLDCDLD